ncbi:proteasome assembly chaperone 3 [Pyrenophora seminiperda CCB06]|uniref:Proteasome assembly chaperone 3 n=1 Tax=Pyrenophora seminiperda CCB06 TaxID=1302712 RepID=A0A3M7LY87_9PLEO|nr:proteasome assembly chaperone 3 [Pyrenophora seminiperda CCB06]
MAAAITTDDYVVTSTPYPARTKTATVVIKSIETTATTVNFADKILITVTQNGRLAHWVHVPLDISATDAAMTSTLERDEEDPNSDLLPMHHLTATTILGGTVAQLDVLGQTLATQIASAIKQRDDRETRMVVVGMGLDKSMIDREAFSELVGLVLEVI